MFSATDAARFVAWTVFTYWQITPATTTNRRGWYEQRKRQISGAPPGWLFGVVWSVLYGMIAFSAFYYFAPAYESDALFLPLFVLVVINLLLNKLWTPIFFGANNVRGALVIAVLMWCSGLAVAILMGIGGAWVSFGLWLPYEVWVMYAIYLNWSFVQLSVGG